MESHPAREAVGDFFEAAGALHHSPESKIITVSAAMRLSPTPPARVESRKQSTLGSAVNASMRSCRSAVGVDPSMRAVR